MPLFKMTVRAKEDLLGIARTTEAKWGRNQRKLYLQQFDEAFHSLAHSPDLGRTCGDIRKGYFKYPQGSHLIFYRQGATADIEIIRVLHKRMDVALHL